MKRTTQAGPRRNLDCEGRLLNPYHCRRVSLAVSRNLRHNKRIRVNRIGFAWVNELIQLILFEEHLECTLGQVLFVVANDRKSKFQADIRSSGAPTT